NYYYNNSSNNQNQNVNKTNLNILKSDALIKNINNTSIEKGIKSSGDRIKELKQLDSSQYDFEEHDCEINSDISDTSQINDNFKLNQDDDDDNENYNDDDGEDESSFENRLKSQLFK